MTREAILAVVNLAVIIVLAGMSASSHVVRQDMEDARVICGHSTTQSIATAYGITRVWCGDDTSKTLFWGNHPAKDIEIYRQTH